MKKKLLIILPVLLISLIFFQCASTHSTASTSERKAVWEKAIDLGPGKIFEMNGYIYVMGYGNSTEKPIALEKAEIRARSALARHLRTGTLEMSRIYGRIIVEEHGVNHAMVIVKMKS